MKRAIFEFPEGYTPDATDLAIGTHISKIKKHDMFVAPDGRTYLVTHTQANPLENGRQEYELWAFCMDENKSGDHPWRGGSHLYTFCAPADADPLKFTFIVTGKQTICDNEAIRAAITLTTFCAERRFRHADPLTGGECNGCIFSNLNACPCSFLPNAPMVPDEFEDFCGLLKAEMEGLINEKGMHHPIEEAEPEDPLEGLEEVSLDELAKLMMLLPAGSEDTEKFVIHGDPEGGEAHGVVVTKSFDVRVFTVAYIGGDCSSSVSVSAHTTEVAAENALKEVLTDLWEYSGLERFYINRRNWPALPTE